MHSCESQLCIIILATCDMIHIVLIQFKSTQFKSTQLNSIQFKSIQINSNQFKSIQINSNQLNSIQINSIQLNSIQFKSIQFKSIQFNSIQFNSIQFKSIQIKSTQFKSIQFNSIQFKSIQFKSIQINSIQFNSIQFNSINSNEISDHSDHSILFNDNIQINQLNHFLLTNSIKSNQKMKFFSNQIDLTQPWIYHYDPETKQQSKEWVEEDAPPPTKVRRAKSVGKQMWAIFFRSSGFVAAVALEDRKTVTADWYTTVCLPKVITEINYQREKAGVRGILLHHDNASSHTALRTREFLEDSGLRTLPHPPYSPDLAPCDFWLFPTIKNELRGRRFSSNEELVGALFKVIEAIPKDEWKMCFQKWFSRMKKCIESHGEYVEKMYYKSSY